MAHEPGGWPGYTRWVRKNEGPLPADGLDHTAWSEREKTGRSTIGDCSIGKGENGERLMESTVVKGLTVILICFMCLVVGCSPGKAQRVKTGLPRGHYREVSWSPEGDKLLFLLSRELFVWSHASRTSHPITFWSSQENKNDYLSPVVPRWMPDSWLSVFREPKAPWDGTRLRDYELVSIDETGSVESLLWIKGLPLDLCWSPSGDMAVITVIAYTRPTGDIYQAYLFDVASQNLISLPDNQFRYCAWGHESDGVLVYGLDNRMGFFEPTTQELYWERSFDNEFASVDSFTWSPSGDWLVFFGLTRPRGAYDYGLYVMDARTHETVERIYDGSVTGIVDWLPEGSLLVAATVGSPAGNELILIEVPDGYR